MKFFIPAATSDQQRDEVYDSVKQHLGKELGAEFASRRIFRLSWRHDGKECVAEVGQVSSFNGELVIAILFEELRDLYHVCTPNRGVVRGGSILAGGGTVFQSEDFEG